jgi:1-acyl-sn-glycerol-3-phosphate acyltransferase
VRGPTVAEDGAEVIGIEVGRRARDGAARERCAGGGSRPCRNHAVVAGLCRVHARAAGIAEGPASGPASGPRADRASGAEPGPASGPAPGRGGPRPASDRDRFGAVDDDLPPADPDGWARLADLVEFVRLVAGGRLEGIGDELAGFLRRRVTGDYPIDEFGFDEDLTANVLMPLVRPLYERYWRVASHGIEHVPLDGPALIVANHAGTLPFDAVITRFDLLERTGRHVRELGADLVFRVPFIGELARKSGVTLASGPDAERLFERGELVAVWPEGFKGLGKPWRERYRLQRFGRGGFVAAALKAQVPIVPTAIVGSEEIYPLLHDARLLARAFGLPYFPIVPQMLALPIIGPLALLPLPSKWLIEYGEPIDTTAFGPEAADDPMVVFDLTDRVRRTIQAMIDRNLAGRSSVFL